MKVTQQSEPKFIPVVITLETQEEVDILTCVVGSVSGAGLYREILNDLYNSLYPLRQEDELTEGALRLKI